MPSFLPSFQPGLPAARVDHALRAALAALDQAQQSALLWFHDVLTRKLYQDLGYASMELYAGQALGFSANRTSQFMKLARDLERLPSLKEAVVEGRLEWTKAQQVARIASPRTAAKWVEAAQNSSRRDLASKVKAARLAQKQKTSGQESLALRATAQALGLLGALNKSALAGAPEGAQLQLDGSAGSAPMALSLTPLPAPLLSSSAHSALPPPRISVTLSFDSLDAARLEAMLEAAKKAKMVPATATREEAILAAMDALIEGGGGGGKGSDSGTGEGGGVEGGGDVDTDDSGAGDNGCNGDILRRHKATTHYKVVLYRCDACQATEVVMGAGRRPVDPAAATAAVENSEVSDAAHSSRSRSVVAPGLRRQVLIRDGHRCRAPGCGSTRFLEIHHRVARAHGGSDRLDNLVTLCSRCHRFVHRYPQAGEVVCGGQPARAASGERPFGPVERSG